MSEKSDRERDLEQRVAELEATVSKMLPDRRGFLKTAAGAAAVGAAGLSGYGVGRGEAAQGDKGIGGPNDYWPGVYAEYGEFNLVNTDDATINQSVTDPVGVTHDTKFVSVQAWNIQPAYTSGPTHGEGGAAFMGAAPLPDGRVVLAPADSSNVGLFDPATDSYTSGPTHGEGGYAFRGAAPLPDGRVVLAPYNSSNVGLSSPYTVTQYPSVANR